MQGKWIYVITNELGQAKIGVSSNLNSRHRNLQTSSPTKLDIKLLIPYRPKLEKFLHDRFKSANLIGEWFEWDKIKFEFLAAVEEFDITYGNIGGNSYYDKSTVDDLKRALPNNHNIRDRIELLGFNPKLIDRALSTEPLIQSEWQEIQILIKYLSRIPSSSAKRCIHCGSPGERLKMQSKVAYCSIGCSLAAEKLRNRAQLERSKLKLASN